MRFSRDFSGRFGGSRTIPELEFRHASLSQPHLRRPPHRGRWRECPSFRLGPPGARPWRPAVHRPARPLRRDADRRRPGFAGVQDRRDGARRVGHPRRRRGQGAHGRDHQQEPADRRDRDFRWRDRGSVRGQGTAAAGVRRARIPGGHPPQIPLPRPAPRHAAQEHRAADEDHFRDAQADGDGRVHRVLDADPDGFVAGRRARLPGAVAHSSRHVLCAAAGTAAVQAADHDERASTAISRSRPASATRTRAPTGCRANSTSSTSR